MELPQTMRTHLSSTPSERFSDIAKVQHPEHSLSVSCRLGQIKHVEFTWIVLDTSTIITKFVALRGDINRDGNVDISDVVELVNIILGQ